MAPLAPAAALAVALVTVVVIVVVLRSARSFVHTAGVVILNLLFAAALLAFVFPPLHTAAPTSVTLLTAGVTDAQRSGALRAPVVFAMSDVALSERERDRIRTVADLPGLKRRYPSATDLSVLGAGLDANAWRESPGWTIDFSPPPARDGVRHAAWQKRLDVGEPLTVSGRLVATGNRPLRVSLRDPSGHTSATMLADADGTFELEGHTRAPGRFVYRLQVESPDGAVLESVPLPVHIVTPRAARIAMLLSSPSFESRALKQWARRAGAELAVRTAISRDRQREEFVNREPVSLTTIDASVLSQFDLLIADTRAWMALAPAQRSAIAQRVADDGLGVLLTVADAADGIDAVLPFPSLVPAAARPAALDVDGLDAAATTVTLAAAMFAGESQALVIDVADEAVAAFAPHGNGRVGVTLVMDSHRLVTAGHVDRHARYWQALVSGLVPPRVEPGIEFAPAFPRPGQRVQVCAYGDELPEAAQMRADAEVISIALQPHRWRPGEACGYLWPERAGWYRLRLGQLDASFYVFAQDAWRARRDAQATADTQLQALGAVEADGDGASPPGPLPRWWFAFVLLFLAAALWLEQKWWETARARAQT
jgi:hypothetical protein